MRVVKGEKKQYQKTKNYIFVLNEQVSKIFCHKNYFHKLGFL